MKYMKQGIDRRNFLKDTVVALTTIAALGSLAACTDKAPTPAATASQTGETPNPSATDTAEQWLPKKGDYLSPEQAAQLETAKDITAAFTFKDGDFATPEELAQLDAYREGAFFMAGNAEWDQFRDNNVIDAFANYEKGRYTEPIVRAMYGDNMTNDHLKNIRYGILQRIDGSKRFAEGIDGKKRGSVPYEIVAYFIKIAEITGSVKSGKITVTYRLGWKDNLADVKMEDMWNADSLTGTYVKTMTVERQPGGSWITVASREDLQS